MSVPYTLILFLLTFIGGCLPLMVKRLNDDAMQYLLAFSGAFLLSMTFLHLLPETFEELGSKAGLFLLVGFFIQLIIQRLTHGVEHGHSHTHHHGHGHHDHSHHVPLLPIMTGLSIHAFMEGLPLGFNYRMNATEPALYMAVTAHKIPEAILIASLILQNTHSKSKTLLGLLAFSLITPVAGIMANQLGTSFHFIAQLVISLIPIVAGAFIHISTTIFFESGTKHHMLTGKKILAILLGLAVGLLTLTLDHSHHI